MRAIHEYRLVMVVAVEYEAVGRAVANVAPSGPDARLGHRSMTYRPDTSLWWWRVLRTTVTGKTWNDIYGSVYSVHSLKPITNLVYIDISMCVLVNISNKSGKRKLDRIILEKNFILWKKLVLIYIFYIWINKNMHLIERWDRRQRGRQNWKVK